MSKVELFSIISSIFSIILAVLSITLSMIFFRWSDKVNKEAQQATQKIESTSEKIEKLFDKLYTDTFGLMSSIVTGMKNSVFPENADSSSRTKTEDQKTDSKIAIELEKKE
jgi:hypothetical protein